MQSVSRKTMSRSGIMVYLHGFPQGGDGWAELVWLFHNDNCYTLHDELLASFTNFAGLGLAIHGIHEHTPAGVRQMQVEATPTRAGRGVMVVLATPVYDTGC